MANTNPQLEWCHVRMGKDLNWWVVEISDEIHWDVDGLGIIDPRQMSHILDLCDSLRDYGFDPDVLDNAFFKFQIEGEIKKSSLVRLSRTSDSIFDEGVQSFVLPNILDEEKGPYADLLDQITKCRVKMLNDLIDFDQNLTIDELEDEIRERQNLDYMEGRAVHFFTELTAILEYVPDGYEADMDEDEIRRPSSEEDLDDIPDFDDSKAEKIEEDETMKWDEEEEEEEEEENDLDDFDAEEELLEKDDKEKEEEPPKRGRPKKR